MKQSSRPKSELYLRIIGAIALSVAAAFVAISAFGQWVKAFHLERIGATGETLIGVLTFLIVLPLFIADQSKRYKMGEKLIKTDTIKINKYVRFVIVSLIVSFLACSDTGIVNALILTLVFVWIPIMVLWFCGKITEPNWQEIRSRGILRVFALAIFMFLLVLLTTTRSVLKLDSSLTLTDMIRELTFLGLVAWITMHVKGFWLPNGNLLKRVADFLTLKN